MPEITHTFNIGDRVLIRPDLHMADMLESPVIVGSMLIYAGQEATIIRMGAWIDLDIDDAGHSWNPRWLLPIVAKEHVFKVGDRVRSRQSNNLYTGKIYQIDTVAMVAYVTRDGDRNWECKIISDTKIATALGVWNGTSYLEFIEAFDPKSHETKCVLYPKNITKKECRVCLECKKYVCYCLEHTYEDLVKIEQSCNREASYGYRDKRDTFNYRYRSLRLQDEE